MDTVTTGKQEGVFKIGFQTSKPYTPLPVFDPFKTQYILLPHSVSPLIFAMNQRLPSQHAMNAQGGLIGGYLVFSLDRYFNLPHYPLWIHSLTGLV